MAEQSYKLSGIMDGWKIVHWEGNAPSLTAAKAKFRKRVKKGSRITSIVPEFGSAKK